TLPDQRNAVLPVRVLEAAEVEVEDDVLQLARAVAGRDQSRGDRAGGSAGDVLRLVAPLVEYGVRTRESDSLHSAALADEIDVVLDVPCCGHQDTPPRFQEPAADNGSNGLPVDTISLRDYSDA